MVDSGLRDRLVAILAADAVGYSSLMAGDERATLRALDAARVAFREAVQRHGGRVVDTAGDSVLAVFETARGAVDAAVDVQRRLEPSPADGSTDGRLRFRIGIHLGDVIVKDDGSVYGNGVNVAARLQALAPSGGITVSDTVCSTLGERSHHRFADHGRHKVRNIAQPIHAYRLASDVDGAAEVVAATRAAVAWRFLSRTRSATVALGVLALAAAALWWASSRPAVDGAAAPTMHAMSLAIAPFDAAPADPSGREVADALRAELATGVVTWERDLVLLTLPAGLEAVAAGARIEGARRAGARYVVEGEVGRQDGATTATLRIVDTGNGAQVGSVRQALGAIDEPRERAAAHRRLVMRLAGSILQAEVRRVAGLPIDGLTPTELTVRAGSVLGSMPSPASAIEVRALLDRALRADPHHVRALAYLGVLLHYAYAVEPRPDRDRVVREMDDLTARAVVLDWRDAFVWNARSLALMYLGRWSAAFEAMDRAIQIDPHNGFLLAHKGWLTTLHGRPADALTLVDAALALRPGNAAYEMRVRCEALLLLGRAASAVPACESTTGLDPTDWAAHLFLAVAYADLGDFGKAAAARRAVQRVVPGHSIGRLRNYRPSEHPDYLRLVEDRWYPGLRRAGMPEQ